MTNPLLKEKSLEHVLAKELRALEEQHEQDQETEFYLAVEQLLTRFGLRAEEAAQVLLAHWPDAHPRSQKPGNDPRSRLKVFRNPYTREEVRTRSYNHQTLNEWRRRHGRLKVQTWQVK